MDISSSHSTFSGDNAFAGKERRPLTPSDTASRRRASFCESVEVHLIEPASEFSEDEKAAAWFSREEFESMKLERRATVKIMERFNAVIDDAYYCYRGLEFKTREGSRRRHWCIVDAAMAVFDEQMPHFGPSSSDSQLARPEAIAKACMASTASSRAAATERGLRDYQVALESASPSSPTSFFSAP